MGVVFGFFFVRTKRVLPLVIAHTLLDVVAFVGYTLLRNRLGFLR
jgi:membrane protease YdiL (CAAX protease family)